MKLSLCLEMIFNDRPFIERIPIASRTGYDAIEFWDWRDKDLKGITESVERHGLTIAAISGNRRNALIDISSRQGLLEEMEEVFEVAHRINCTNLMMLSDVLKRDGSAEPTPPLTVQEKMDTMAGNLRALADHPGSRGLTLLLEPLNTVLDHSGCFLDSSAAGVEVVANVNRSNVKLLYDIYHMSMMNEDALSEIEKNRGSIGYLHAADMPGRHQPGSGRIDYPAISAMLAAMGYDGFIGMEFSAYGLDEEAIAAALKIFRSVETENRIPSSVIG